MIHYDRPMIDAHAHVADGPAGIRLIERIEDAYGYDGANVMSVEAMDKPLQNVTCLLLKKERPHWSVFGGLNHHAGDLAGQLRELTAAGFSGIKLIEGKPDTYTLWNRPLNGPDFLEFFAEAERSGPAVLAHVADPPECWDRSRAPAFLIENGWVYDGPGFPSREELYAQIEDVVTRFPRLKLILAHFYFLGGELERAADFLDRHPAVCFDVCPGSEMYVRFARSPAAARDFFLRYSGRLLFGTDNYEARSAREVADMDVLNELIHRFLQTDGPFLAWDLPLYGIDLPEDCLDAIYGGNFRRLTGPVPAFDREAALAFADRRLAAPERYGCTPEDARELAALRAALAS